MAIRITQKELARMTGTKKEHLHRVAGDICDLANQRFGLSMGMMMLMRGTMISSGDRDKIILLAKNREFDELELLLNQIKFTNRSK